MLHLGLQVCLYVTTSPCRKPYCMLPCLHSQKRMHSFATCIQGYKDVPPRLFPNFIHYNFPAPASLDDGRSPLAVVSKLATANDFVSIKVWHDVKTWTH